MRHVSRTHRVALDRLSDRINLDSKIQIKYIDTKNQLADFFTKGNFTRDEWNHLCVCSISAISVPQFVLKRWQKDYNTIQEKNESQQNRSQWWNWSRDAAIGLAMQQKDSWRATFYCIRKPGENQTRKSISSKPANWAAIVERRDPFYTQTQQATLHGTLMKHGLLLKSNEHWWITANYTTTIPESATRNLMTHDNSSTMPPFPESATLCTCAATALMISNALCPKFASCRRHMRPIQNGRNTDFTTQIYQNEVK